MPSTICYEVLGTVKPVALKLELETRAVENDLKHVVFLRLYRITRITACCFLDMRTSDFRSQEYPISPSYVNDAINEIITTAKHKK